MFASFARVPLRALKSLRTLYRFRREVWYSLTGSRFEDLRSSIHRDLSGINGIAVSLRGLQQIESDNIPPARWAVVSCIPPEDTGIAPCTFYSWLACDTRLDFFSPAGEIDWFLGLADLAAQKSRTKVRLLDQKLLMKCMVKYNYAGVLFVLGNSNHHNYTARLLQQCQSIGMMDRVVLHIHDPCMLNYVQRAKALSNPGFMAYLGRLYGIEFSFGGSVEADRFALHQALVRDGILGLRHFTALGIRSLIVNSGAAAQLVARDLASNVPVVYETFHPIFLPNGVPVNGPKCSPVSSQHAIKIGVFGVPGDSKRTGSIIAAVLILQRRGYDVKLVLAGYQMAHFARKHAHAIRRVESVVADSPSDAELVELMAGVDVAVQLRAQNLGESSGIVAQLLALGVTTIVTNLGSFREYGDAVVMVDADVTEEQLADVMLASYQSPPDGMAMKAFVEKNSVAAFQARMLSIFSQIENTARGARPSCVTGLHLAV